MNDDTHTTTWVMYLIVKKSLGMSAGKIAAQVGHGVGMLYEQYNKLMLQNQIYGENPAAKGLISINEEKLSKFNQWKQDSFAKIVKQADDAEFDKIKNDLSSFIAVVRDAGFTEVPAGSETVIAIWPTDRNQAPKLIKRLQLLK